MDIMRQGKSVEVMSPIELRQQVKKELQQALGQYGV
jgi:predicted DNA-binding transcriptional regulator YafY